MLMNMPMDVIDTMLEKIDLLWHAEKNNALVEKFNLTGVMPIADTKQIDLIRRMQVGRGLTLSDFRNTAYQLDTLIIDVAQLERFLFGFTFTSD